jgi:hypothetical protein
MSRFSIGKPSIEPVDWPTNLGWRIQFRRYVDVDPLHDIRRDKLFAMPFRNWLPTYWALTGKDAKKLRYMPIQVIEIPDDALVADMETIDTVFFLKGRKSELCDEARSALGRYVDGAVAYSVFKEDPWMFSKPEILIDRSQVRVVDARVALTGLSDPDEVPEFGVPLLGLKMP